MVETQKTDSKTFLWNNAYAESNRFFGGNAKCKTDRVVRNWMDDDIHSKHRLNTIRLYLPNTKTILDLASGCGTCVYCGLKNGLDMFGIEPEMWKNVFNGMKASQYEYPKEWQSRFIVAYGENLPFANDSFDCVTSYQTLEHVDDPRAVLSEMIRVTRPCGGIHLHCPDYRSTFEPHYRLPWLPLFPKSVAKLYLKILGRPTIGLDSLHYVTKPFVYDALKQIAKNNPDIKLKIIDVDRDRFYEALRKRRIPRFPLAYNIWKTMMHMAQLFRAEFNINIFICVISK